MINLRRNTNNILLLFSFDNNDWLIFSIKAFGAIMNLVLKVCYVDMLYNIVRRIDRLYMRACMTWREVLRFIFYRKLLFANSYRKSSKHETI